MDSGDRQLTDSWTGKTDFELLRPTPPPFHKWVEGRLARIKKGTRPDNIWREFWRGMSTKRQQQAIKDWEHIAKEREEARAKRGRHYIPDDEVDDYNRQMSEVREFLSTPAAPVMPCIGFANSLAKREGRPSAQHQENTQPAGHATGEYFGLVHTPIPMSKALQIPEAKAAVEK